MQRTTASFARLRRVARAARPGLTRVVTAGALTLGLLALPATGAMSGSGPKILVAEAAGQTCPRTLAMGDHGKDVQLLQQKLNQHFRNVDTQSALRGNPYLVREDGDFGAKTANSVARYQEEIGALADTVVGPETWRALKVC